MSLSTSEPQAQMNDFTGLFASRPKWHRWVSAALDVVFPPRCAACGRVDMRWCDRCEAQLAAWPVNKQSALTSDILEIYATSLHDGLLAQAVHALKYQEMPHLAVPLARRLANVLNTWRIQPDVIVPVPLHPQRQQERGYNQSALLAWELSALTDIPLRLDLVERTRYTRAQVGLDRQNRLTNMADAFYAQNSDGLRVLIIDDVATTGATMTQCAQALRSAGSSQIYGLTVSMARHTGGVFTDEPLSNTYLKESL